MYEVAIQKVTNDAVIGHLPPFHNGKDRLHLRQGIDLSGQRWQWLYIERIMEDGQVFQLPPYGMVRLTVRDKPHHWDKIDTHELIDNGYEQLSFLE